MNVLVTGGTGFIGQAVVLELESAGHRVTVLTRQNPPAVLRRLYVKQLQDIPAGTRFQAIINLAGESMAGKRWTSAYKDLLSHSRINTTKELVNYINSLENPPEVLLSASAVGYYGHHREQPLAEGSVVVPGFSAQLCQRWEAEAMRAQTAATRVCLLRLGVVLDRGGGAVTEMRKSFNFGIASWMGNGRQWLSWIHRRDVVRGIMFLLGRADLQGPYNLTAPEPVTGRGFSDGLRQHMSTFMTLPLPGVLLRVLLGEMAQELLLNGQRVLPARLQQGGFSFDYPTLDKALEAII